MPTIKAGGTFNVEETIESIKAQIDRGDKKENILKALAGLAHGFKQYQEKVG